jgi:hypothetical protein
MLKSSVEYSRKVKGNDVMLQKRFKDKNKLL